MVTQNELLNLAAYLNSYVELVNRMNLKKQILIIEPAGKISQSIDLLLGAALITPHRAACAEEARTILDSLPGEIDAILCADELFGIPGREFAGKLRKDGGIIPFILMAELAKIETPAFAELLENRAIFTLLPLPAAGMQIMMIVNLALSLKRIGN